MYMYKVVELCRQIRWRKLVLISLVFKSHSDQSMNTSIGVLMNIFIIIARLFQDLFFLLQLMTRQQSGLLQSSHD